MATEAHEQIALAVAAAVHPFDLLFSSAPDTGCRTTWREEPDLSGPCRVECVEVPMDDLRKAFAAATKAFGS